jgi:uncharacterized protein YbjT (DUF2867 family)
VSVTRAVLLLFIGILSASPDADADGVLIFGATRNTGLEVAKILSARGEPVTAFVRPSSDVGELEQLGVSYFKGDAMDADDVAAAITSRDFNAVISTLGGGRGERPPDLVGTINIVDAMERANTKRLIVVTIIGPGKSMVMVPEPQRKSLGGVIALKVQAENYISDSELDYTILRPGQLTSNPRSGIIRISEDTAPTGPVTRSDLADMVVKVYDDSSSVGKVYQVIGDDPLATVRMDRQ